ncbi:MAG: CHAT domain-containing protein [Ardenticatenaceae bacterium]|nr:CHAT domain-containing protein [Ardenticatenaceae bacterium]
MAHKTYENLDIHIGFATTHQQYPVTVAYSEGGGRTEKPYPLTIPLDDFAFTDPIDFVQDLIADSQEALDVGQQLAGLLFQGDVRDMFIARWTLAEQEQRRLRIRLRVDPPELSRLPWELCYFTGNIKNYFALNLQTPLVRYIAQPSDEGEVEAVPEQVKVLLAIANPHNDLKVAEEEAYIQQALKPLAEAGRVKLMVERDVNWFSLQQALNREQPHVLHFVGHGDFVDEQGVLVLHQRNEGDDGRLPAAGIKPLVRGVKESLKVVFLNACHSGKAGMKRAARGVAQAIIEAGVPAVVAMQTKVPDAIAADFARIFYEQLAGAEPLDVAVTQMRIGANAGGYFGCIPILFMRDSGEARVWRPREAAQEKEAKGVVSTAVFQPLLALDYVNQTDAFYDVQEAVTASLLSSDPAPINNNTNNLRLLLRRLIGEMPHSVTIQPLKLDISPKNPNAPVPPDGYWFQLAHYVQVDVSQFSDPYSDEDKQAIVQAVSTRLETMHLVMVMEQLTPQTYKPLVEQFWQLLRQKLAQTAPKHRLVLFLLDNSGFYSLMPQVYPMSSEAGFAVEMPVVKAFDRQTLVRWLRQVRNLAADAKMQALVAQDETADLILQKSANGVPEMVLKHICDACGYEWEGQFSAWLKP